MALTGKLSVVVFVLYVLCTVVENQTYTTCPVESLHTCMCRSHNSSLYIECHNASLHAIPADIPNNTDTMYIYLDDIPVLEQRAFAQLRNLTLLELPNNNVKHINTSAFDGLVALQSLNLAHNAITDLEKGVLDGLTNLLALELPGNRLRHITTGLFNDLGKLERLHLERNEIADLQAGAFDGLINMKSLLINRNHLTQIPTLALKTIPSDSLFVLSLYQNRITHVGKHAFNMDSMKGLGFLYLNDNIIDSVDDTAFLGLSLYALDLAGNKITSLTAKVFEDLFLPRVGDIAPTLTLSGNPLLCDCEMWSFVDWVNTADVTVNGQCHNPINMRGRNLTEMTSSDLRCFVDLVHPQGNRTIGIGFSAEICCELKSTHSDGVGIRWFGPTGSYLHVETPCLVVNMTSRVDAGLYSCVALGDGFYGEATIAVSIPTPLIETSTAPPTTVDLTTKNSKAQPATEKSTTQITTATSGSTPPNFDVSYKDWLIIAICVFAMFLIVMVTVISCCVRRRRLKREKRNATVRTSSVMYSPMNGDVVHMNAEFNSKHKYSKMPPDRL